MRSNLQLSGKLHKLKLGIGLFSLGNIIRSIWIIYSYLVTSLKYKTTTHTQMGETHHMEQRRTRRKALTPCKDSEEPPLFSGSGPWLHSPGKCWVLWKETTFIFLFIFWHSLLVPCLWQAGLCLSSRWVFVKWVGGQTLCLCGQEVWGHSELQLWRRSQ